MIRGTITAAAAPHINVDTLVPWLDENAPQLGDGPLDADFLSGGSSNIVLRLNRGGQPLVLRRSPKVGAPGSEKTIAREARILAGLKGSTVPHPTFQGFSDDPAVNGAPFYLMEMVIGWAATVTESGTTLPARFSSGPDHHYLGWAMLEGLIRMANFDYKASSLADFGKPESFVERQVQRWRATLEGYPALYPGYQQRDIPGLDCIAAWLGNNMPANPVPGLMHADYALNNVLFADEPPSRLLAIIDWETATIGDPLIDLAAFCKSLTDERFPGLEKRMNYFDSSNFPSRQQVMRHYARQTGRDLASLDFYGVLNTYRKACMMEYKVAEAAAGLSPKSKGERFAKIVTHTVADTADFIRRLG
jgi:aminoglycoside phosphotransferase (APT) family kinase protein